MKKILSLCLGTLLAAPAFAGIVVDGNLSDWGVKQNGLASGWTPNAGINFTVEDQTTVGNGYLNPGYGGQAYDAEALYATIQGGKLFIALATGHNPRTINNPANNTYGAGDFGIDFGKNGSYDLGINIKYSTGANTVEGFGVEGGVYKNPTWALGLWDVNGGEAAKTHLAPNPLHPTSMTGGTLIGNANLAYTTSGARNYGQYTNDLHYFYEMSLDLALLTEAGWDGHSAFNIQWTENCANDMILVDPAFNIPEPASLALLSVGLLGVIGSRRRKNTVAV